MQDAVLEVLEAMGRCRQPKDDGARALEDTRDNALVVYRAAWVVMPEPTTRTLARPSNGAGSGDSTAFACSVPPVKSTTTRTNAGWFPIRIWFAVRAAEAAVGTAQAIAATAKEARRVRLMGTGKHAAARGSRDLVGTRLIAVDFELTSEQREVQATVRQFVDERILPNAIENDINHHLDMGAIEGMAELGLLGVVIPEEYGGAGLDFVSEALVCEEIERGEAAFRTLISVHVGLNSLTLLRYGTRSRSSATSFPRRAERSWPASD